MATTADISNGIAILHNGEIHVITSFQHVNPGKGSAFVRSRLKNIKTGKTLEHTYKSGEAIDLIELDRTRVQYLYKDASGFYFMNPTTYEQLSMSALEVGDVARFLQDGGEVTMLSHNDRPVLIEIPKKMTFLVASAPPSIKGDTAQGRVTKEAVLENGVTVQVPLFVDAGNKIVVNTETGEYVERA